MPRKDNNKEIQISPFKMFLYLCLIGFFTLLLVGFTMLPDDKFTEVDDGTIPKFQDKHSDDSRALLESISEPLILWWTGFTGEPGKIRKCGKHSCFFTIDRHYMNHHQTKVLMFYGSDIKFNDLPIPRNRDHEWALLHEESPKNNYALTTPEFIELFNHTSTFQRQSDFPLTLQSIESLEWLESSKYVISTIEKNKLQSEYALVNYVQSDCGTPSDRDNYVTLLMQELAVDSYGTCLHNKDLPEHLIEPIGGMDHVDFYTLQANYKFTLAMENAICDDYVTEKLWRPLMVGSVPIIHGSSKIRDLLPDNHSAVIIDDFKSVKELADYIKYLNSNDEEYNKYLQWKKTGITNLNLKKLMESRTWDIVDTWKNGKSNFVEDFECFVCNRIHENIRRRKRGDSPLSYQADATHLQCPGPMNFNSDGQKQFDGSSWIYEYEQKKFEGKAVRYFVDKSLPITSGDLHAKVSELRYKSKKGWFL